MRSRPFMSLSVRPERLLPGMTLAADVLLTGQSRTPISAVDVAFRAVERYFSGGNERLHTHVHEATRFPGFVLEEGARKLLHCEFDLAPDHPRTLNGSSMRFATELVVHVDIPWWPDAELAWTLDVAGTPKTPASRPEVYAHPRGGPRGNELGMEIAVQRSEFLPGETVQGQLVLTNCAHHPVKRVEVRLINTEDVKVGWPRARQQLDVVGPISIFEGAPFDDERYAFELRVPRGATPTMLGAFASLVWHLEARAHVEGEPNIEMQVPLTVHTPGGAAPLSRPRPSTFAPLFGAERRRELWVRVAGKHGLLFDLRPEHLTGTVGAVSIDVALELRKGTLWTVATLQCPDARLDLEVNERTWLDVLRPNPSTGHEAFDERFLHRARDPQQARAFLSEALREALLPFSRATLDDGGAMLASPGDGDAPDELDSFVKHVMLAARALSESTASVPMPEGLEPCRAAWAAFAASLGATFFPGDCSIRGAKVRDFEAELATLFDGAKPRATVARLLLPRPAPDHLPEAAAKALASIVAEVPRACVTQRAVELELPCPYLTPERAETSWRTLLRLALELAVEGP
jgi:hypothetical protein